MQQQESMNQQPPMTPSNEAKPEQLRLAKQQGEALRAALDEMINKEAHDGGMLRAGDYLVAYAVEKAEGLYHMRDGKLEWVKPQSENMHLEVAVMDGADGRFIPGLTVHATLIDANGKEVGTHRQEFIWHPWLYHYGRNWTVPGDGEYTLRARIEPPVYMRHDEKNGKRYEQPVEVEFRNVKIKTGQK